CDAQTDEERKPGLGSPPDPACGTGDYDWYYRDNDADFYGQAIDSRCLCGPFLKYTATVAGDCNDGSPMISPAATEKCNAFDDDCDGLIDEERTSGTCGTDSYQTFFLDADADGWGRDGSTKCLCAASGRYATLTGQDCDDAKGAVHPGAIEVCGNLVDEDCDGQTDEPGCSGCTDWYLDADGDGFGAAGTSPTCLSAPSGNWRAPVAGDCNDADAAVFPGQVEKCNSKDDDCDAATDEARTAEACGTDGYTVFYKDSDADTWGLANDTRCTCSGVAPYTATRAGDCSDSNSAANPGKAELCSTAFDDDCNGVVNDDGSAGCTAFYTDADRDGWGTGTSRCKCSPAAPVDAAQAGDCLDTDPAVYPGVTEKCNGKDDDCDGATDEERVAGTCGQDGYVAFYQDHDRDGHGVAGTTKCLCGGTGEWDALVGNDCDDGNNAINPTEDEICNGVDDNCNNQTDEVGATGCTVYYRDVDNDGHGVASAFLCLCTPSGYFRATVADDCNDSIATIYKGATEKCNGVDDDCDGATDEERVGTCGADGYSTYWLDADNDTYGVTGATRCLCAASGEFRATRPGDCDDTKNAVNPAAYEKCNGFDDDCDLSVDEDRTSGTCGTDGYETYWYSADGDAFGVATPAPRCGCEPAAPYSATAAGDCNDADAQVYPGATETCNAKDDDCDASTDEERTGTCAGGGYLTFFSDADGDTYGTAAQKCLCAASGTYTASRGGDCDDTRAAVNPDATEKCNLFDDNCNTAVDEERTTGTCGTDGYKTLWQDQDADTP
ncbi:MAG: putative metal-binding motif-containing protein, partial [Deltaproteobacteria bacterium]|nr:putative metal-binding motif-containing protein [Deltaproteobacteria bacterium]